MADSSAGSASAQAHENFLFDDLLSEFDPDVQRLVDLEEARQSDKLQMIASESLCPKPVLAALGSSFINKYAEGYPSTRMSRRERRELANVERHLSFYRRYGDRRYYKGTEYCDLVESLAQTRLAQLFENENAPFRKIWCNVQSLSGAPANNAVYDVVVKPGDVVMGLHLSHGGHLTHGSPVNRSGKVFKAVPYTVHPDTWRFDYDAIHALAKEVRPKLLIGGASAYPWDIDWIRFREIADEVGAKVLADISHPAGLAAVGLFPNPVGLADVTMFTTHKTMCGPRGAVLISTDRELSRKLDLAVFPGEQGGPHLNTIAAKAVSFRIAQTDAFRRLQRRIVDNAAALVEAFQKRDLPVAFGGTNTHLCLLDLRRMKWPSGVPLTADVASNILDLCGLTLNKNTLPGDTNAARPSGLRFGTVVLTQRGMGRAEMEKIAEIVKKVLVAIEPFHIRGTMSRLTRGRIDFGLMSEIRAEVDAMIRRFPPYREKSGLERSAPAPRVPPVSEADVDRAEQQGAVAFDLTDRPVIEVVGERATPFLDQASASSIRGDTRTRFLEASGRLVDEGIVVRREDDEKGRSCYWVLGGTRRLYDWLRALSDGYVRVDAEDVHSKVHGPVAVRDLTRVREAGRQRFHLALRGPKSRSLAAGTVVEVEGTRHLIVDRVTLPQAVRQFESAGCVIARSDLYRPGAEPAAELTQPFFVGQRMIRESATTDRKPFEFQPPKAGARRTPILPQHKELGAHLLPFGGYTMPGWYGRVAEEHCAVRETAGLFDVGHMGVFDFRGESAGAFLDTVTTNFVHRLEPGQSQYTYVLDIDGKVMDDIIVYRMERDRFITVVNASNQDKLWQWLTGVNERRFILDREATEKVAPGPIEIRNLKQVSSGDDAKMDLALQGPASQTVMERLIGNRDQLDAVRALKKFNHTDAILGEIPAMVSRTGYTGESRGYEILAHPRQASALWTLLLETGKDLGIRPTGLAARDSTRAEAGFPLYGHELAGEFNVIPAEAGYASFVKRHKPFFVGKQPIMHREDETKFRVARIRLKEEGGRAVRTGDAVISPKGKVCGYVTSAVMVGKVQILLAYIRRMHAKEGRELGIHRLSRKEGAAPKVGTKLEPTDEAVVLSRFHLFGG